MMKGQVSLGSKNMIMTVQKPVLIQDIDGMMQHTEVTGGNVKTMMVEISKDVNVYMALHVQMDNVHMLI
jgi:hypothetical protein